MKIEVKQHNKETKRYTLPNRCRESLINLLDFISCETGVTEGSSK